jgi:hypothetical protein
MRLAARASPLVAATPPRRAPHAGGSAAPHARGRCVLDVSLHLARFAAP